MTSTMYRVLAPRHPPVAESHHTPGTESPKPITKPITNNKAEKKNKTQIPNDWVPTAETKAKLSRLSVLNQPN